MGKSALESLVPPSNEKKSVAIACSRLLICEMEKFHRRNVRLSVGRLVATHVSGGDAI
jgi:hypothetical protein